MDDAAEPLISVALCTYNGERYLRQQLDSLLAQTYSNMEVVAIDDASTDGTAELLREYASRDSRLRVFVNPRNLGFVRNFERAITLCNGALIAPCDQDDVWLRHKLRTLANHIGEHSMAYCDSELIDAEGRSLGWRMSRIWAMQDLNDPAALVLSNCVSGHAMLFRRELIDGQPPLPADVFHDWWLAMRAAARNGAVYCPEPLVRYRQHGKNVTNIMRRRQSRSRMPGIPGSSMKRFEDTSKRLAHLAAVGDAHSPFFADFHRLWVSSERMWFAPRLAAFMWRHRRRLYPLRKKGRLSAVRKSLSHVFGLRLRRLFKPTKYGRVMAFV